MYYPVKVLGPGSRVGIWLNGCNQNCDGCISPEMQRYDVSKEVSIDDVEKMINRIQSPIDGFTISGGEPFFKPVALNALVNMLSRYSDDILIFSGFTLEELKKRNDVDIESVLRNCAVLIDGPFVKELQGIHGLRGSSNQKIWIFKHSEKYAGIDTKKRSLQNVVFGNAVLTIGIPERSASID